MAIFLQYGLILRPFGAQFADKVLDAVKGDAQVVQRVGVGNAQEALAAFAEGAAGHHGHFLAPQQLQSKLLTGHAEFLDTGEYIEGSIGFKAFQSHFFKTAQ